MAQEKVFITNAEFKGNSIKNAVIDSTTAIVNLSAAPASPIAGTQYFNTTDNTLYYYNGTSWISWISSVLAIDMQNIGTGQGIYAGNTTTTTTKTFKLRSILGSTNISISSGSNDITISATGLATTTSLTSLSSSISSSIGTLSGSLNTRINTNATNITALRTRVTGIEAKTGSYATITQLNASSSTLQSNINTVSTNLTTLQSSLGTAAYKNTGTTSGTIPIIGSDGKISSTILPQIAITSVSTGTTFPASGSVETGDIFIRTDGESFIYSSGSNSGVGPTGDTNWLAMDPGTEITLDQVFADTRFTDLVSRVSALEATSSRLVASASRFDTASSSFNSSISTLNTEYSTLNTNLGNTNTKLTAVSTSLSNLETNLGTVTNIPHYYAGTITSTTGTATVTAATHNCGISPVAFIYSGTTEVMAGVDIDTTGNITINWDPTSISGNTLNIRVIGH